MENFLRNQYFVAFVYGYLLVGFVADLIISKIMIYVQEKAANSYKEMYGADPPIGLDSEKRKSFSWGPRIIGVIERIFYTSAIVFNQFTLIGVWLVFKAIGEWSDFPSRNRENREKVKEGTTRIRANNFLIGNAVSLLSGILGGVIFRLTLDFNFLANLIQKSYK